MTDHDEHDLDHDDEEVIVLTDDEGKEHEFTIVQVLKVDGQNYAILLPANVDPDDDEIDDDDEGAAFIFRIDEDENGEEVLVEIEDEDEFDRVADAWEELLEEEDYDDDDDEDSPMAGENDDE